MLVIFVFFSFVFDILFPYFEFLCIFCYSFLFLIFFPLNLGLPPVFLYVCKCVLKVRQGASVVLCGKDQAGIRDAVKRQVHDKGRGRKVRGGRDVALSVRPRERKIY